MDKDTEYKPTHWPTLEQNGYSFINTELAVQIAKFWQTPAIRLQAVCKEPVTHVIFLDLHIDGRQFKEVPLLIADLVNHEIILGRKI